MRRPPAGDIIHMFGFHKDIWYKFTETPICAMNFSNIIHNHIEYIIVWMCRSFRDTIYIAKINIIPETENLFS